MKKRRIRRNSKCKRCPAKQHDKCGYCLSHLPLELRCTQTTRKGKRCKLPLVTGADICKTHISNPGTGRGSGKYGWVYVFDTGHDEGERRLYKVGRSTDLKQRTNALRAGNPRGDMTFAGFVGEKAKKVEGRLHRAMIRAGRLVEREIFALSKHDLKRLRDTMMQDALEWKDFRP